MVSPDVIKFARPNIRALGWTEVSADVEKRGSDLPGDLETLDDGNYGLLN